MHGHRTLVVCSLLLASCATAPEARQHGTISGLSAVEGAAELCDHRVPAKVCTRHHPELVAEFKKVGDWCGEHGVPESQCFECHPDLTFDPLPKLPADADLRLLSRAGEDVPSLADHAAPGKVTVFDFYAEWCAVDMLAPDGSVERLAVHHPDPERIDWVTQLAREYPFDRQAVAGVARVIRTGEPEWLREIPEALLAQVAKDEKHLELIRKLGLRSYLCVPLKSRGVVRGALSLVLSDSGRLYDENDFRLAIELAQRASLAVDNALLYQEARDAVRLRDEFLSVASHELKTPLTPLNLRLESLAREAPQNARAQGHIEVAQRQIRKLASLVDGLLDVSRIAAGRLHLEFDAVDLSALARDVAARWEPEAARVSSSFVIEAPDPVVGQWDRLRLEQIVTNLVSNAIKYGAGKPIHVRVGLEGGHARLEVQDHGIGIAASDLRRIFGRFERAVSVRNYGGLGLGLYISRRIAEALGGTIAVESAPGAGSTFSVTLPTGPKKASA